METEGESGSVEWVGLNDILPKLDTAFASVMFAVGLLFLMMCLTRYANREITKEEAKESIANKCQDDPVVLTQFEEVLSNEELISELVA